MRPTLKSSMGFLLAAFLLTASPALAQTGAVVGQVVDAETRRPIQGAQVQVLRGGAGSDGTLSDAQGRFRLQLPVGTYVLLVEYIGYTSQRLDEGGGIEVRAGGTTEVTVELVSTALQLAGLEVTTRRSGDATKATESPNHVAIVSEDAIERRAAVTPVEHVKALPGVDASQTGLGSSNVVARGFNNVFSGALLVLTDNRIAAVPSLRVNSYNMIPSNDFDTERIEVLLGPAAALYGPNSASGVMHIITASPIDRTGTKVRLSGGERSVFMGQFRTAFNFGDEGAEEFGFKVSGQYMRGEDWQCWDPSVPPGDLDPASVCDAAEFALNQGDPRLPDRNYDLERWSGEARFDWRPSEDTELIATAGINNLGSSIEMTGVGSGQANDWRYTFGQARFRTGRFFAQAFLNQSDAGETVLLRSGEPIVDKSRLMVAQLQHGFNWGERQDFIYGADFQFTRPRTEGTITGANEDDDDIDEIGGYLHSETVLSESLKLIAALRVDYHNRLEDLVYSPRAALVFEPIEDQAFRISYNRAFSTPTTNNLFLDLGAGSLPGTPYGVRTRGVPETGFTFNSRCAGGVQDFCMYSPFAPQLGQIPANGLPLWDELVFQVLASQGAEALAPALQNPGAAPNDPSIESRFLRFDQEGAAVGQPFAPDPGIMEIGRIDPTIFNNFEVGYQGILGDRLLVQADLYTQQITDFVGPLRTETPNVFYDPETVQLYVRKRLEEQGLLGTVVSEEEAAAIIEGMSSIPLGTVSPDQTPEYCARSNNRSGCETDLILTYRNFGDVDLWGGDLAFQFLATDRLSVTGSYSHVSQECFDFDEDGSCSGAQDIALNAPRNKGSVGAAWNDVQAGLSADARVRFTQGFPMNSGVFVGTVDSYTVVDATVNYILPWFPGASVGITASNLLDNFHQEFVGAPFLGRLIMAQMTYEF